MLDLEAEVLEEFCEAGAVARQDRFEAEARYVAERSEEERERDRERKADRRDMRAILAELRRLEGIEERFCACGCGRIFPVNVGPGRPQEYATVTCRVRACIRSKLKRRKSEGT
jgi:hypothetical protein